MRTVVGDRADQLNDEALNQYERDPRRWVERSPMSRLQWAAVVVTIALAALDGYDILAMALVAPALKTAWNLSHAEIGSLLSVGLIGMAGGSLVVAPLADRFGRRPLIYLSLILTGLGMALSAGADGRGELLAYRLAAGIGIGTMISIINPLATEFSNHKHRVLALSLMAIGVPIGGVAGGIVAAQILSSGGWRLVFGFGATLSLVMTPIVWLWLPETLGFLIERPNQHSLARVNGLLARFGQAPVAALPLPRAQPGTTPALTIFSAAHLGRTLHVTAINLTFVVVVYYVISWMPQLVADRGFSAGEAASVGLISSIAGVISGILFGWIAPRIGLRRSSICIFIAMGVLTAFFALLPASLDLLRITAALVGFALYSGMVATHSVISQTFGDSQRATGAGFVIGIGRIGSAFVPFITGILFSHGFGPEGVSAVMGGIAGISALLLSLFGLVKPAPAKALSS